MSTSSTYYIKYNFRQLKRNSIHFPSWLVSQSVGWSANEIKLFTLFNFIIFYFRCKLNDVTSFTDLGKDESLLQQIFITMLLTSFYDLKETYEDQDNTSSFIKVQEKCEQAAPSPFNKIEGKRYEMSLKSQNTFILKTKV